MAPFGLSEEEKKKILEQHKELEKVAREKKEEMKKGLKGLKKEEEKK